jgi:hypothetical protein
MHTFLAIWFSGLKPVRRHLGGHWEQWKPIGPGGVVWVQLAECSYRTGLSPIGCSPLWRPKCEEHSK